MAIFLMNQYEVGKSIAEFKGMTEGAYLAIDEGGLTLTLLFNRPTDKEIADMRSERPASFRFQTMMDILYLCFKFGDMPWMEAPYSPWIGKMPELPENIAENEGLALLVILADTRDGVIKALRLIGLGHRFSVQLVDAVNQLKSKPLSRMQYDQEIAMIIQRYTTKQIVDMASSYFNIR